MSAADVQIEEHAGNLVSLRLTGELDLATSGEVRGRLVDALPNEVAGAVLDLTDLDFLDSAGIRLVFEVARAMREHGQHLRVAVTPKSIPGEVIAHVGLAQSVPIDADPHTALDRLRDGAAPPG